jgi:Ca2+-transporting ATPase
MIHMPPVLTAAWIPFAGYPLLYLPLHIVWLELLIHPTALLVFQDLPQSDTLPRLPRGRERGFFTRREWLVVGLVGALMTLAVVGGYAYSLGVGRDVEHARAMALIVLSVASATLTAGLSGLRHRTARVMVTVTLGLSGVLVQTPGLATLLNLRPLHLDDWMLAVVGGVLVALLPAFTWPGGRASAAVPVTPPASRG